MGAQKQMRVFSHDGQFLWSLKFSADSKALIAGGYRGLVKLWPLDGPTEAATFPGHSGSVEGLASQPDEHRLISAGSDIRFWDVRTRRETGKLNPRSGLFISLALSPDGRRLAAGASNGRIMIWDAASLEEVATLDGHNEEVKQLAFTPDGDHLVSASPDQLRVWRAASWADTDTLMKLNK
jgi:WD40 repeat protein